MADEQQQQSDQEETYTPPATQDDLNRIITERVSRERSKYGDYAALKAKAKQFDDAQEASKSELQKAIDRAEAAEKKAASLEAATQINQWAADIAKETGVPADALRGSTQEELQAHADILKTLIAPPKKGAVGPYVSNEGATPNTPLGTTAEKFGAFLQEQFK